MTTVRELGLPPGWAPRWFGTAGMAALMLALPYITCGAFVALPLGLLVRGAPLSEIRLAPVSPTRA